MEGKGLVTDVEQHATSTQDSGRMPVELIRRGAHVEAEQPEEPFVWL